MGDLEFCYSRVRLMELCNGAAHDRGGFLEIIKLDNVFNCIADKMDNVR